MLVRIRVGRRVAKRNCFKVYLEEAKHTLLVFVLESLFYMFPDSVIRLDEGEHDANTSLRLRL